MNLGELGEFGLIYRLRERMLARRPGNQVIAGIGDDAALLPGTGHDQLLLTTDALVEGVHFRSKWMPPDSLGWKALAVNLSDIAAMGGTPAWALVTLGLPATMPTGAVEDIYLGMDELGREHGTAVAGGDIVSSPVLFINVVVAGSVPAGQALRRSRAAVGDLLVVTGALGASAAGLAVLGAGRQSEKGYYPLVRAHLRPVPRLEAGRALAQGQLAHACIDLSDGLGGDLRHLCRESGVGACLHLDQLPITEETEAAALALGADPLSWAVSGGEDYELLLAIAPESWEAAEQALLGAGCQPAAVGEVVPSGEGITAVRPDGSRTALGSGYTHF